MPSTSNLLRGEADIRSFESFPESPESYKELASECQVGTRAWEAPRDGGGNDNEELPISPW